MIFRVLDFYRLSGLVCPDFVGTTGLGCCISACLFLGYACNSLGTYFNLLVWIVALESCGTHE